MCFQYGAKLNNLLQVGHCFLQAFTEDVPSIISQSYSLKYPSSMLCCGIYAAFGTDFSELFSNSIFLKVSYCTTFSLIVIGFAASFYLVLRIYWSESLDQLVFILATECLSSSVHLSFCVCFQLNLMRLRQFSHFQEQYLLGSQWFSLECVSYAFDIFDYASELSWSGSILQCYQREFSLEGFWGVTVFLRFKNLNGSWVLDKFI